MNKRADRYVREFARAAARQGKASQDGNYKVANRNYYLEVRLVRRIKAAGELLSLRVLLDDENPWVRLAAATYLLEVDEPNAIRILKEIGTQHGFVSLDAKIILDQWRTERKSFIPDLPES